MMSKKFVLLLLANLCAGFFCTAQNSTWHKGNLHTHSYWSGFRKSWDAYASAVHNLQSVTPENQEDAFEQVDALGRDFDTVSLRCAQFAAGRCRNMIRHCEIAIQQAHAAEGACSSSK